MTSFSERQGEETPRTHLDISLTAWRGIAALIQSKINDGSFGATYGDLCPDGFGICGVDENIFWDSLLAEIPKLKDRESLRTLEVPSTTSIMDMIEFCWRAIAKPEQGSFHSYFQHHHLSFDVESGRTDFAEAINRIFRRNGLAYELTSAGEVYRLAPEVLRESLTAMIFNTGDTELDSMIETARRKFLNSDEGVRRESLEKLWDAWERIKTLEQGKDKKTQIAALMNRVSSEVGTNFKNTLDSEAIELTRIGNTFQIRHSETSQERLKSSEQVDYLFHRLFAVIRLILRVTNRAA